VASRKAAPGRGPARLACPGAACYLSAILKKIATKEPIPDMKLSITEKDGVLLVGDLPQKFDYTVCNEALRHITPALDGGPKKLVISFTGVGFLDSCGIGTLITLRNRLMKEKGAMALCDIGERLENILKITDLRKVFALYGNADQAVSALAGGQGS
jgi:stage II sporulation protein AA (anti-sigma F factor antagonist)